MIPNITKGAKPIGLLNYLAGPGKANEHTRPHVVAASDVMMLFAPEGIVTAEEVKMLGREIDAPRRAIVGEDMKVFSRKKAHSMVADGMPVATALDEATSTQNVWHCSLSLSADEGELGDDRWQQIATAFMAKMEFDSPDDPRPAPRWLALHHGQSTVGNDHIHIAVSTVREDGTRLNLHNDFSRAQKAAHELEAEFGLQVTRGRAERYTTRGENPAQQQRAARDHRTETAKTTLTRRVRAMAAAAESEAEFVRMVRADGLLIRPRRAAGPDSAVTGYSVALPTADYATRDGRPVWHGGGKLAPELTLPRLREMWPADDGSKADAMSAWAHNLREPIATPAKADTTLSRDRAKDVLRTRVSDAAKNASTEAAFVRAVAQAGVLIRPRYKEGSTTVVTGYSVALRPHLFADNNGQPVWHGGGKLDNALSLPELRKRWPFSDLHAQMAASAWRSPGTSTGARQDAAEARQEHTGQQRSAHAAAGRWQSKVEGLRHDPSTTSESWAVAATDTAGAVAALSLRTEKQPAELARLADALATVSGQRRAAADSGRRGMSAGRRVAAVLMAGSSGDSAALWIAVFSQLSATSKAIADATEARGYAARARELQRALAAAEMRYAAAETAPRTESQGPVLARPARSTVDVDPARTRGHGR